MKYHFSKIISGTHDDAVLLITAKLKEQGFGVLTTIDVKKTLKEKIDADFRPYTILGACNPHFAYKVLSAESHIGVMLPCSVVVQENKPGEIEVSAINPMDAMQSVSNKDIEPFAIEVAEKLRTAIESL